MGLLLSKLHVMSCLCPTVQQQQQQQHCALLHESPQTAQRSWFMSSFLFISFFYSSVPLLCVVWSGQVVHDYKYPYQSNVSKR